MGCYMAHDEKLLATDRQTLVGTFIDRPFDAISENFFDQLFDVKSTFTNLSIDVKL
jgi:hypothetical protein